jgi:hypothetical protein
LRGKTKEGFIFLFQNTTKRPFLKKEVRFFGGEYANTPFFRAKSAFTGTAKRLYGCKDDSG